MVAKYLSGKTKLIGQSVMYDLPIPLDPAVYIGGSVAAKDGAGNINLYFSDGEDWVQHISSTIITETIEEAIQDVSRSLPAVSLEILISAADLGDIEGVRYFRIQDALQWLSGFFFEYDPDWQTSGNIRVWLRIETGKVIQEQILNRNVNLSAVNIVADDPVVLVDCSFLTRRSSLNENRHAFIQIVSGGSGPNIGGVIFSPTGTVPQDPDVVALTGAYTPRSQGMIVSGGADVVSRSSNIDTTPITQRAGGFEDWDYNLQVSTGGSVATRGASFNDAIFVGIDASGTLSLQQVTATGCGESGMSVSRGAVTISPIGAGSGAGVGGVWGQDFRRTVGVNTATDIVVINGGTVQLSNNARGGFSIPFNTFSSAGIAFSSAANRTYVRDNILGAVSESAGVPTGAIIEQGSNANGNYQRLADGTQKTWRTSTATLGIATASFGGFTSSNSTSAFAASFIAPPVVVAGVAAGSAFGVRVNTRTIASASISWLAVTSQGSADREADVIAIGRWF